MQPMLNRRTAILTLSATMLPVGTFSALAQAAAALTPDEALALAQEAWVFGMPLVYIATQINQPRPVANRRGRSRRSTSLHSIESSPTLPTGRSSASMSIPFIRSRRSTSRKAQSCCPFLIWATASGSCN